MSARTQAPFWILMGLLAFYTGQAGMRSMDSSCAFKDVSVDQEDYPEEAQMALEVYVW